MEVFIALLLVIMTLLLIGVTYQQRYWCRRGIPHDTPAVLVGNMQDFQKTKHISTIFRKTYSKYKGTGPFAGFNFFMIRSALILDIDLVRNILVKDFNNFVDRGIFHNERDDPLTGNLFFLDGEKWRKLRHKMSPTFTSNKMKFMFSTVAKIGAELAAVFDEKVQMAEGKDKGAVLEVIDLLGRYTADVIGSCAFGLECNSLRNQNAEFVAMGKQFLLDRRHSKIVDGLIHSFPDMARKMRMRIIQNAVNDFYLRIVRETIDHRERNNIKRNDFMDMLIELKNQKTLKDENGQEIEGLSVDEVAAQAFVFFIAGYETSSTTMGLALYELAQHQKIQDKVRAEISNVLRRHRGEFTYESMGEMQYLEQVIDETLRMHPVVGHLIRRAQKRYETSHPKYYIEKDTMVIIPSMAIHYDPEYYPEPHSFKPERFTPDEVRKRPPCTWLPFGEGPRNCIGLRFGKMQTSIGLASLLSNFKFSVAPETQIPYTLNNKSFLLSVQDGINLKVQHV